MSLLAKFTVTPLLWACGLLLAACGGLGVKLHMMRADVQVAEMSSRSAMYMVDRVTTERDAWKGAAETSLGANVEWQRTHARMRELLAEAQGESKRLDAAGEAALADAQARAEESDRTLATWMAQYADQVRMGDCAAALNAMQQACPAFEGY